MFFHRCFRRCAPAALLLMLGIAGPAAAQRLAVEAVAGAPFGVARIMLPSLDTVPGDPWADGRVDVTAPGGRVLYPAFADGPVRQMIRRFVQVRRGRSVFFLFAGNEPFDVTVTAPEPVTYRIVPADAGAIVHRRLLTAWWREYARSAVRRTGTSDYPAMVDAYLVATLARRLGYPAPDLGPRGLLQPADDDGLELLLGTEGIKLRNQIRDLGPRVAVADDADVSLPAEPQWPAINYPAAAADVAVEPIAMRVPEDCFYLRCGSYDNYSWMQALMDEWGGELRNMVTERGVNFGISARIEQLLGLKETAFSRAFGSSVIADVAIIGADPFFREGPAMGMLFQAKNNFLASQSFFKQRSEALAGAGETARDEFVEIGGRRVSLMSTPDGSLRSYYVADGDYHLITTSKTMVRDFLEVGRNKGAGSLGRSAGFRHARSEFPVDRGDTLLLYMSDPFFRRLASPQYRIEMMRRLRSITEMQSLQLARLAAIAEGKPGETIEQLVAADLLPAGFGRRADGSRIVEKDGRLADSIRGALGTFVPVADMPVPQVSAAEAAEYAAFVRDYRNSPSRMDPIMAAVARSQTEAKDVERLSLDVRVAPLRAEQFQRLSQYLGPARAERIAPLAGDVIRIEGNGPRGNYLFFGLQEFAAPLVVSQGVLRWGMDNFDAARGYLGGSPNLEILERLLNLVAGNVASGPDAQGYVRYPLGLWQRNLPEMTVLSFKREVLDRVTPQLEFQAIDAPAQIQLDVADLSKTELAPAINSFGYQHARNVSIGNTALFTLLSRQLHVPPDRSRKTAEALVGAELVCALGGQYRLENTADGRGFWRSSAWSGANQAALTEIPSDYVFPVMQWLRGMNAQFVGLGDRLILQADILVQRKPVAQGGFTWPALPKREPQKPAAKKPVPETPPEPPVVEELPPPQPAPGR